MTVENAIPDQTRLGKLVRQPGREFQMYSLENGGRIKHKKSALKPHLDGDH